MEKVTAPNHGELDAVAVETAEAQSRPVGIPDTKGRPWYVKEKWPAIVGLAVGFPAAAFAFYAECTAEKPNVWKLVGVGLAAASVLGLGVLKLLQSLDKDAKDDAKSSPEDLRGCLHVIYRIVAGYKRLDNPPDEWLRITVHRVDTVKKTLEQSVDYVGSKDGGAGREFPIHSGLIGKVARERPIKPRLFERPATTNGSTILSVS